MVSLHIGIQFQDFSGCKKFVHVYYSATFNCVIQIHKYSTITSIYQTIYPIQSNPILSYPFVSNPSNPSNPTLLYIVVGDGRYRPFMHFVLQSRPIIDFFYMFFFYVVGKITPVFVSFYRSNPLFTLLHTLFWPVWERCKNCGKSKSGKLWCHVGQTLSYAGIYLPTYLPTYLSIYLSISLSLSLSLSHSLSCPVLSCHAMPCHVMSCDVMSCHVLSCPVIFLSVWNHACTVYTLRWSKGVLQLYNPIAHSSPINMFNTSLLWSLFDVVSSPTSSGEAPRNGHCQAASLRTSSVHPMAIPSLRVIRSRPPTAQCFTIDRLVLPQFCQLPNI